MGGRGARSGAGGGGTWIGKPGWKDRANLTGTEKQVDYALDIIEKTMRGVQADQEYAKKETPDFYFPEIYDNAKTTLEKMATSGQPAAGIIRQKSYLHSDNFDGTADPGIFYDHLSAYGDYDDYVLLEFGWRKKK